MYEVVWSSSPQNGEETGKRKAGSEDITLGYSFVKVREHQGYGWVEIPSQKQGPKTLLNFI